MSDPIGTAPCPTCDKPSPVFQAQGRNQRSPFYRIKCEDCGVHQPRGEKGQEWIKRHAGLIQAPVTPPPDTPAPARPAPRPARAGGLLSMIWSDD